jgi:hypothetical protein
MPALFDRLTGLKDKGASVRDEHVATVRAVRCLLLHTSGFPDFHCSSIKRKPPLGSSFERRPLAHAVTILMLARVCKRRLRAFVQART